MLGGVECDLLCKCMARISDLVDAKGHLFTSL